MDLVLVDQLRGAFTFLVLLRLRNFFNYHASWWYSSGKINSLASIRNIDEIFFFISHILSERNFTVIVVAPHTWDNNCPLVWYLLGLSFVFFSGIFIVVIVIVLFGLGWVIDKIAFVAFVGGARDQNLISGGSGRRWIPSLRSLVLNQYLLIKWFIFFFLLLLSLLFEFC